MTERWLENENPPKLLKTQVIARSHDVECRFGIITDAAISLIRLGMRNKEFLDSELLLLTDRHVVGQ
ncbi:hypothetical protein SAMN06265219_105188 [Gracilimonas mengyeensis]|uniref:Uncharacterized protein n=1 Tax=Gracilimonas mengyeensis TaxID=1302730 RepID=A0A521CIA7_9BACT|nr:hypothetical protein SAMN06265219_105188 [Gracilimonas mengyeensis]